MYRLVCVFYSGRSCFQRPKAIQNGTWNENGWFNFNINMILLINLKLHRLILCFSWNTSLYLQPPLDRLTSCRRPRPQGFGCSFRGPASDCIMTSITCFFLCQQQWILLLRLEEANTEIHDWHLMRLQSQQSGRGSVEHFLCHCPALAMKKTSLLVIYSLQAIRFRKSI